MNQSRQDKRILDVSKIQSLTELHCLLKKNLELPEYYGMNWDAFWDAITGLIELPEILIFEGWNDFKERLPEESQILIDILNDFNVHNPHEKCSVVFK